ncbi:MAG: prepilin-type N-terminal cleavage/methylation domain-containing protein [Holophagales bacterium]|nr:prepilin-type N-terminal cleavage/methylation domain-containing protein [Holophagales bacterium]
MRHRRSSGFTLIEVLIVVAIIGIIVAIAVINYLNAIDRARQRRSMSDMRSIATAVEAYAADLDRYPPASAFILPAGLDLPTLNLLNTVPYLQPTYMKAVPLVDGWNSWFLYGTTAARSDYALRSTGRGGEPQAAAVFGPTTDFTDDIILVNGQFVQWPEGVQR